MVKAAVAATVLAAAMALSGTPAQADAKLINAKNSNPIKDAVQVFRGEEAIAFDQRETEVPALQAATQTTIPTLNLVNAGNGWLLDRKNGRIINCYRISSGYVGRRDIRCIAAKINSVVY